MQQEKGYFPGESTTTEHGIIIPREINYTRQKSLHSDQEPEHGTFYLDLEPDDTISNLIESIEKERTEVQGTPIRYRIVRESRKDDVEKDTIKLVKLIQEDLEEYMKGAIVKKITHNEFDYHINKSDFVFRTALRIDSERDSKKIEIINYVYSGRFDSETRNVYGNIFNPLGEKVNITILNAVIYSILTGRSIEKKKDTPFDIGGVTLRLKPEGKLNLYHCFVTVTELLTDEKKKKVADSLSFLYDDLHNKNTKNALFNLVTKLYDRKISDTNQMIKDLSYNQFRGRSKEFLEYVVQLEDMNSQLNQYKNH